MPLAEGILSDYLHKLRTQFYDSDKKFFQQRAMLIRGITHLAVWLNDRGAGLPERRYRQILDEIITGIKRHGDTGKIEYFCRYFLHVVQKHVHHNQEAYYDEAKDFRNALETLSGKLSAKQATKVEEAKENTTECLASMAKLLRSGPKRGTKRPQAVQTTLF